MDWIAGQETSAIIAGAVSLSIGMALIAIKRTAKVPSGFAPEGVARAILMDRKWRYRSFRSLKYHLSGFTDDELRKILVRAGAIRLTAGGQEIWGLLSRNRKYLSIDEIEEAPTTEVALDRPGQEQNPQEVMPQAQPDFSRPSSDSFERLRAEMAKLGTLECVRPVARQE
jgi:hypothetical protein